jgi:pentalenolactone synthase
VQIVGRSDSVQRVVSPGGDPAWLVEGYARVKELLADPRISRSHPDPAHIARRTLPAVFGGPIGDPETERADHLRMRRLLTRAFSAKRMDGLRPRVQAIVEVLLADLERSGPPADFHRGVSAVLPLAVMCELLGVPPAELDDLRRWSEDATRTDHPARARTGLESLWRHLGALVERKHWKPGEDVVSDLVAAAETDPALKDDAIAHVVAGLLFAGNATAVSVIDRGVLLLLAHLDQRRALERDPSLVPTAVEEILRSRSPMDKPRGAPRGGLPRYAAVDVAVDGVTMRAGDLIMFALDDANQDAEMFPDPGRFDITRKENPHLAFSHGLHFCIGAPLARMELQVLFEQVFRRFPTLRLAVPVESIRPIPQRVAGAVAELPVTW